MHLSVKSFKFVKGKNPVMEEKTNRSELSQNTRVVIFSFSIFTLLLHFYSNLFANYGIFRDEFYYLACTNHLSAGYVDQPPLSIYLLALSKWIFGTSLFAIRLLPSVTAALTVYLTGILTARIGGKTIAVLAACSALAFSPIFLGVNSIFSMNTFEHFFWVLAAYIVVRIIQQDRPSLWILLGIVLGLGMLNKISMVWFGAGLFVGIIFTPLRVSLKTRWPYLTALVAFLIFSPFIVWNITHDFAHLEFMGNATAYKYNTITPLDFISGQLLYPGPVSILVWLPGILFLFFNKEARKYRMLGIIFLTAFLILVLNWHSKSEYLAPAYPLILAGGGLFIERTFTRRSLGWIKYAIISLIVLTGIISIPAALPVLSVNSFISYSKSLGLNQQNSEHKELADLPQFYADMFGWEDLARTVSSVYSSVPDSEKSTTIIFASNYGQAGALEYYSAKYRLPPVICPQNSYWYWCAPDTNNIKTVIVIGGNIKDHESTCRDVKLAAVHRTKYSMPYENNLPIYICRDIYRSLKEVWQKSRFFI
jgi:hypothetical protein